MGPTTAHDPVTLPPLESGDRMTRVEFERRYHAMPANKKRKAELIDGVVIMASPTKHMHGNRHALLTAWTVAYSIATPGTSPFSESTLRLDEDNEPEPDDGLRLLPQVGGRSREEEDGYLRGPVELVAEVALSSASHDLHQKKDVYRRHGCAEYLVVVLHSREVHWFALREGLYQPLTPDADGVLRSEVFPGLWLDPKALLSGDGAALMATLQRGLASPEHAAFAARLRATGGSS